MELTIKRKYCPKCRKNRYLWRKSHKKYVIAKTGGTLYYCERCNFKLRKQLKRKK